MLPEGMPEGCSFLNIFLYKVITYKFVCDMKTFAYTYIFCCTSFSKTTNYLYCTLKSRGHFIASSAAKSSRQNLTSLEQRYKSPQNKSPNKTVQSRHRTSHGNSCYLSEIIYLLFISTYSLLYKKIPISHIKKDYPNLIDLYN